ncbi:MAG: ribonuclease HII [Candidatus Zambryskibacteria bacterium]|nr:ribonuclease HII [Candidatus Zambryskibacteria bacterium]
MKLIIGIDEAGRGSLAGPLTLSIFAAPQNLRNKLIKILGGKIKDSKKISPENREKIYKEFLRLRKANQIDFNVAHTTNIIIDRRGISYATKLGIKKCLNKLEHTNCGKEGSPSSFEKCGVIRLDGLLKAPEKYKNQKTIIGGDEKNIFIACASVVAKVRRDRLMCRYAKKFSQYSFEIHKGYGTALHYKLLKKHGLSILHRRSFLKKLIK